MVYRYHAAFYVPEAAAGYTVKLRVASAWVSFVVRHRIAGVWA